MARMSAMIIQGSPSEDEAGAIAAVVAVLEQETSGSVPAQLSGRPVWRAAGLLEAQGFEAVHGGDQATWGKATRVARSRRWSKGIV